MRGAFLCRLREDGETLVSRGDPNEPTCLIDAHDGVLFLTPHDDRSPMMLVALPRVDPPLVRERVEDEWAERAPKRVVSAWRAGHGLDG